MKVFTRPIGDINYVQDFIVVNKFGPLKFEDVKSEILPGDYGKYHFYRLTLFNKPAYDKDEKASKEDKQFISEIVIAIPLKYIYY